nr:EAL domain-containing protein [Dechloromonas sp.]
MERAPEREEPVRRQLWIALVSLALGGFLLLGYVLWSGYKETWAEAQATARSHAELLEARFDATLRRVDSDLAELTDEVPHEALLKSQVSHYRKRIEADLERYRLAFPEVAGFRLIDAQGDVLYVSGGGTYANLADRPYFKAMRDGKVRAMVFSEVLTSRITNRPSLAAGRAIRTADGRFIGAVTVAIELEYFQKLFQGVHLGKSGALAIRRSDTHSLVVRQPHVPGEINRPLDASHPVRQSLSRGEREGSLEFAAQSDGIKRIYAYRTLESYPFYVLAGLAEADVTAVWQQRSLLVGGLGMGLFLCLAIVLIWLFRAQERELRAAEVLRRNRDQLKEAQRIAQVGSWEIDIASLAVVGSEELYRIFEVAPRPGAVHYDEFFKVIHPEDRITVDQALGAAMKAHRTVSLKHRLQMPDGRIKYVQESCESECLADGTPWRLIGTSQDVTSQHRMEAEMQLLVSAFQFSGEAIVITDSDNNIVTVNPAFSELTGYTAEDAIGRNPRFLSAGRTSNEEYDQMWAGINERGFWQGEVWDRRKDGGVYPKWMSISVIRDDAGKIRYHVAHFTDVSAERAVEAKLHHMAHHDVLTGLINRFSLKSRLDQALSAARRLGSQVALLFIDLDRFKGINDTLGHHIGDQLLVEVANRLRDSVRDSDVVARLGGDEFVVMLAGIEHSNAVAMVAEKIVLATGDPYRVEGYDLYTTPSIGIAIFPTDGEDGETLMRNADAAMYHAKTAGRNNFQFFDAKMNDAALERLKIEHSLRQALARDEFCLHFQPILDIASGRVAGLEALIRWNHPEQGLLMPGRFIGVAEETGLIQPLGDWVFWAACKQLADFRAAGIFGVKMGVNISAIQMRNGNLPILARGAIEAFGLNPAELVFEITESVAMQQPQETVRILDALHDMGVGLAIDDFGTGYSSLTYLRLFPIDHLKLDRSFVEEIGQSPDGTIICDATIGLAHNLGLKVVAEGVETEVQCDYLRERGCDLMQGYLFSRPVPAADVMAFIRQRNLS